MTLASASTGNLASHLGVAGRVDRIVLLDPTGDDIARGCFTLLTVGSGFCSHELAELRSGKTGFDNRPTRDSRKRRAHADRCRSTVVTMGRLS